MATAEPLPPPTPCDVLATLRHAAHDLQSWAAHIEAFAGDLNSGQIINARRIGRIVQATVNEALCATQAIEHAATTSDVAAGTRT
jgi:hypothetical protein